MAYSANQLVMIAHGAEGGVAVTLGGPNIANNFYHYATSNSVATIEAANYFNNAAALLQVGDVIHVSADLGGTPALKSVIVTSNNGTTVVVVGGGQAADIGALTDSTGGTPATTLAAITAGATYAQADMVAVKNALSQLALSVNTLRTNMQAVGQMSTPTD